LAKSHTLQAGEDFGILRKTPGFLLRKNNFAVDFHVEYAAASFDKLYFNACLFLDFGRQTGGPGEVISLPAIFDGDFWHASPLGA